MLILILLVLILLVEWCSSYSVEIKPGSKECFSEVAYKVNPCSGSFEVIQGDPKGLIVTVTGPSPKNTLHYESKYDGDEEKDLSEGTFSFDTTDKGDYTMCLQNGDEDNNDGIVRVVGFNFRIMNSILTSSYEYAGLETEINDMKLGLELLKDHQSYMNQREDVHRATLDAINTKVLCWTILEAIILIGMAVWQISYISGFFETKRKL
jgi:hypothetical protein